jgi:hypothetical protein
LARQLATWVLDHLVPKGPIALAGDDTGEEHKGMHVAGKGRHRDPVRSTHSYTAFRWGPKGVVVTVLVRFGITRRPWALPVLVALYRPEEENRRLGRRHKTPPELRRQLRRVLLRWFPQRRFVATADGNYATHDRARFAARSPGRLTYVRHFYADANLYEPAPPAGGPKRSGRPRRVPRPPRRPRW